MPKRKKVIIVDDDSRYREPLKEFLIRDADVETFIDPDAFAEKMTAPKDLQDVYLIVLDYCFDSFNAFDKDLVTYLREDLKYKGHLVLWSLEDKIPSKFSKNFDAILPKKLLSLSEIEQCLERS